MADLVVNVVREWQAYEVWLDTSVQARDGVCIGTGTTRRRALASAIRELEAALATVRKDDAELEGRDG